MRQTSQNRADLCLYIEANSDSLFSRKLTEKNTEAVNYLFECFICKQLVGRPWQRPSGFGSLTCQWQRALAARARSGLFNGRVFWHQSGWWGGVRVGGLGELGVGVSETA